MRRASLVLLLGVMVGLGGTNCDDGDGTSTGDGGLADGLADGDSHGGDASVGGGGSGGSAPSDAANASGGNGGRSPDAATGNPDTPASCVTETFTLAMVGPNGGSECGFDLPRSIPFGGINLVLTPGWGTVCYATSSQGCGSGASADGWWLNGDSVLLCDATCDRFNSKVGVGRLTIRLGCPTETCKH